MASILIVGLGNPGSKYDKTRHNAGFLALDSLAKKLDVTFKSDSARHAEIGEAHYKDQKVILAKPSTFMNNSGDAVMAIAERFHIEPKDVWVIADDVALPLGTMRVRLGGGAGGHNGLKSVIERLGTELFPRFKIGVDEKPLNVPLEAWVLSKFSTDEMTILKEVISQTVEAVTNALEGGLDASTMKIALDEGERE